MLHGNICPIIIKILVVELCVYLRGFIRRQFNPSKIWCIELWKFNIPYNLKIKIRRLLYNIPVEWQGEVEGKFPKLNTGW
jgi:hypothetical protein